MSKQQADWRIKQCARERDALAATIKKNQEANERCAMAKWENDTHATIMRNKDKRLFHALQGQRAAELDRRRASLSQILRDEKEVPFFIFSPIWNFYKILTHEFYILPKQKHIF